MTAMGDPYRSYRRTQVETADQASLLLMLYSGALKFLKLAKKALEDDDIEETNHQLGRAQDVLCELMSSLNPDLPDISGSLFQLYEYMHYQLVQANIKKDVAMVEEVEKMLNSLLEAWQAAVKQEKAAAAPEPGTEMTTTDQKG